MAVIRPDEHPPAHDHRREPDSCVGEERPLLAARRQVSALHTPVHRRAEEHALPRDGDMKHIIETDAVPQFHALVEPAILARPSKLRRSGRGGHPALRERRGERRDRVTDARAVVQIRGPVGTGCGCREAKHGGQKRAEEGGVHGRIGRNA